METFRIPLRARGFFGKWNLLGWRIFLFNTRKNFSSTLFPGPAKTSVSGPTTYVAAINFNSSGWLSINQSSREPLRLPSSRPEENICARWRREVNRSSLLGDEACVFGIYFCPHCWKRWLFAPSENKSLESSSPPRFVSFKLRVFLYLCCKLLSPPTTSVLTFSTSFSRRSMNHFARDLSRQRWLPGCLTFNPAPRATSTKRSQQVEIPKRKKKSSRR